MTLAVQRRSLTAVPLRRPGFATVHGIAGSYRYTAVEQPDHLDLVTQVLAIRQKKTPAPDLGAPNRERGQGAARRTPARPGRGFGATIDATARHLTRLAGCEIVQLTGMSGNLDDNPVEVLRRVAELSGGQVQVQSIYAPLTVATAEAATALKTDPQILATFERFASVTVAVVAVGSWDPPQSRYYTGLRKAERERLLAPDVIADVGGVLLDRAGRPVHDFDDRVLGVSAEQLATIKQVIAVGGGEGKIEAMRAALRSGLVNSVITDDAACLPTVEPRHPLRVLSQGGRGQVVGGAVEAMPAPVVAPCSAGVGMDEGVLDVLQRGAPSLSDSVA
jgi:hypothetical protein